MLSCSRFVVFLSGDALVVKEENIKFARPLVQKQSSLFRNGGGGEEVGDVASGKFEHVVAKSLLNPPLLRKQIPHRRPTRENVATSHGMDSRP